MILTRVSFQTATAFLVALLVAVSTGVVAWQGSFAIRSTLSASDYTHLLQAILLYGIFLWMLFSLAVEAVGQVVEAFQRAPAQPNPAIAAREFYAAPDDSRLLVMVPSYREEPETIWRTLVSAALAEHTSRDVVLLIDDPERSTTSAHEFLLRSARTLPVELQNTFDEIAGSFQDELQWFEARRLTGPDLAFECVHLTALYRRAAHWLEQQSRYFLAKRGSSINHTDRLFVDVILRRPAAEHRAHGETLSRKVLNLEEIAAEYLRLASLFAVRFSSFERKRYANLSHAPNKAMNLNSYIALIGGAYQEQQTADGLTLVACEPAEATLVVPAYEFVVVVDADSLITSNYAVRLIGLMRQPENARVAVAQSPYTAIPDAPTTIERAASASTDAQYFTHQGLASVGGSTWVGASALLRYRALLDIATERVERGHTVKIFIKDDILIEDAAATIDLLRSGWTVLHDKMRLSYSETPPDFGSLIIQRRRWANGGLLLLPRLLRVMFATRCRDCGIGTVIIRTPNLTSAATNGVFFTVLLLMPFDNSVVPSWMAGIMLPSLLLVRLGLARAGYTWNDLLLVQALNFLLVPVNLAGTIHSLRQAITGRTIPFARTPKVNGRTRTPPLYVAAIYAIILYALLAAAMDLSDRHYSHAAFSLLTCAIYIFCVFKFLGLRQSLNDLVVPLASISERLLRLEEGARVPLRAMLPIRRLRPSISRTDDRH